MRPWARRSGPPAIPPETRRGATGSGPSHKTGGVRKGCRRSSPYATALAQANETAGSAIYGIAELRELSTHVLGHPDAGSQKSVEALERWLLNHIRTEDEALAEFLRTASGAGERA